MGTYKGSGDPPGAGQGVARGERGLPRRSWGCRERNQALLEAGQAGHSLAFRLSSHLLLSKLNRKSEAFEGWGSFHTLHPCLGPEQVQKSGGWDWEGKRKTPHTVAKHTHQHSEHSMSP